MTVAGHDCVVLRLKDGRTTSIPVDVLEAEPEEEEEHEPGKAQVHRPRTSPFH